MICGWTDKNIVQLDIFAISIFVTFSCNLFFASIVFLDIFNLYICYFSCNFVSASLLLLQICIDALFLQTPNTQKGPHSLLNLKIYLSPQYNTMKICFCWIRLHLFKIECIPVFGPHHLPYCGFPFIVFLLNLFSFSFPPIGNKCHIFMKLGVWGQRHTQWQRQIQNVFFYNIFIA